MAEIISPNPSFGHIEYPTGEESEIFVISKAGMALEKISENNFLYLSVTASHLERHGGAEVDVLDVDFILVMPVLFSALTTDQVIDLPKMDSNHPDWERTSYSVFYRFEHFIILSGQIRVRIKDESYKIILEGQVGEGLESDHKFSFRAEFVAELNNKIDRKKIFFLG